MLSVLDETLTVSHATISFCWQNCLYYRYHAYLILSRYVRPID